MRILLLTDGIYPHTVGGMQKHSYYLGKFLARLGAKVEIVIPTRKRFKGPKTEDFLTERESNNIFITEVDSPQSFYFPGHYLYENYRYSKNIYNNISASPSDYDFIFAQGYTAWYYLQKRNTRRPPVGVHFHGAEMYQPGKGLGAQLEKWMLRTPASYCLRHADIVYSLGGKLTPLLKKVAPANQIKEVPIGIEENWLLNSDIYTTEPRKFIFIGRYEKRKGIELLHKVINQTGDNSFTFDFIGPIPGSKQIKHPSVTYHGIIREEQQIKTILDECDVLFCPSYSEGMPTVILEAMSRGLAVAATDVGAVSSLVSSETGWLMEPGNFNQLRDVFDDAVAMDEVGLISKKKAARRLIRDNYTWEHVARLNLDVIQKLVADKVNEV